MKIVQRRHWQAARNYGKTGADAVKLEGGTDLAPHVKCLVDSGIPVLGHIGLLPQHAVAGAAFRITGRSEEEANQLHKDANALVEAGVFGIVMEGISNRWPHQLPNLAPCQQSVLVPRRFVMGKFL